MRVDESDCLQIRLDGRGADEFHAALLEVFGENVGYWRSRADMVVDDFAVGPLPEIVRKAAILLGNFPKHAGIAQTLSKSSPAKA